MINKTTYRGKQQDFYISHYILYISWSRFLHFPLHFVYIMIKIFTFPTTFCIYHDQKFLHFPLHFVYIMIKIFTFPTTFCIYHDQDFYISHYILYIFHYQLYCRSQIYNYWTKKKDHDIQSIYADEKIQAVKNVGVGVNANGIPTFPMTVNKSCHTPPSFLLIFIYCWICSHADQCGWNICRWTLYSQQVNKLHIQQLHVPVMSL
jgi:hypothetical protein